MFPVTVNSQSNSPSKERFTRRATSTCSSRNTEEGQNGLKCGAGGWGWGVGGAERALLKETDLKLKGSVVFVLAEGFYRE